MTTHNEFMNACRGWTADQLDQAIKQLGELRAGKEPQVPMNFSYGGPYDALEDARWNTQREALAGKSMLHFRHPGFGWLHFAIPPEEAKQLAGHLLSQVAETESQAGKAPDA